MLSSNFSLRICSLLALVSSVSAFAPTTIRQTSSSNVQLDAHRQDMQIESSRRSFLSSMGGTAVAATAVLTQSQPAYAASTKDALIADLNESYAKLVTIPDLLQQQEWDKVRTILKTPPIVQLWNLGDSKNTLVQLAKETGDFELLEAKDELSISLQMCDQYTYDNVFVYFQPGSGKVKIKEPVEMAEKAKSQLKEVLDFVSK